MRLSLTIVVSSVSAIEVEMQSCSLLPDRVAMLHKIFARFREIKLSADTGRHRDGRKYSRLAEYLFGFRRALRALRQPSQM